MTYPEWQKQMREEQAAVVAERAAEQAEFEAQMVREAAELSAKAAEYLAALGLPEGSQKDRGRRIDSFYFSYVNSHLSICRIPDDEDADKFDELDDLLWKSRLVPAVPSDPGDIRVWIANSLDEIETDYQRDLDRYNKRQEVAEQAKVITLQTDAERVYELLHRVFQILNDSQEF